MVTTHATRSEWLSWIFDRSGEGSWWNWDDDADWIVLSDDVLLDYATSLLAAPGELLRFTDEQLGSGLWFAVDPADGDLLRPCLEPALPVADRVRGVVATVSLFRELFARRCPPVLSHLDEEGDSPLSLACYMWWDLGPFHPDVEEPIALACLETMERTLAIAHDGCREAALHGLGHFQSAGPLEARRRQIVEGFLEGPAELRPELREYAEAALYGVVL